MLKVMYLATAILIILVASQQAAAEFYSWTTEFYSWTDDAGIRHISTHPPECIEAGIFQRLKPGCTPITPTAEQRQQFAKERQERALQEQIEAQQQHCDSLKRDMDRLRDEITEAQMPPDPHTMDLRQIVNAPIRFALLHREFLKVHQEYDECVPESEIPERIAYRNSIRQQQEQNAETLNQNVRQSRQQSTLDQIEGEVRDLRRALDGY